MTVFLSGGAKCGKSSLAQDLAVALAGENKHYYVATLIPVDEEDRERIRRHLEDRDGMGFETIECGRDLLSCMEMADRTGTFLLDSVTSLLQNVMFPPEKHYEMDLEAVPKCEADLITFARSVRHGVFVSDYIYSDAVRYDASTQLYRQYLAQIDRSLARVCDVVLEISAGRIIVHKGAYPL